MKSRIKSSRRSFNRSVNLGVNLWIRKLKIKRSKGKIIGIFLNGLKEFLSLLDQASMKSMDKDLDMFLMVMVVLQL